MAEPLEDVKGRLKEAAGAATDRANLEREGEAQQRKAAAEEQAARHENRADAARVDAAQAESEERQNQ